MRPLQVLLSEPPRRRSNDGATTAWLVSFGVLISCSWAVYQHQFLKLPTPLSALSAAKGGGVGFSEFEALKHVKALTDLGAHPLGSDALDRAVEYVFEAAKKVKETAAEGVEVEVELFKPDIGVNNVDSGPFTGKSLIYSGLKHVLIRISPISSRNLSEAQENAILVSAHIDTVFSAEGAGDDSSSVATMLELSRALSQYSTGFKSSVVFLFNTGEEDDQAGAHSFITQHPFAETIRIAIDLEAQGIGGKSGLFQTAPDPFSIKRYSSSAKYPSGSVVSQDIFASGVINSENDFNIYREIGGFPGLDFAYTDSNQVYHTKNDKFKLLKPGSLQHLGDNTLPFLLQASSSTELPKVKAMKGEEKADYDPPVFYDILGTYMIVYPQSYAKFLHSEVIVVYSFMLLASVAEGGYASVISLGLASLGTILMVLFSIAFSVPVAFILPKISSTPVPYIASPWLVIGLFAAPALLGAFAGQHLVYIILKLYLSSAYSKQKKSLLVQDDEIKLEAETWLFRGGSVLWLVILIIGTYYKVGSSYLALFWLVPSAFNYFSHKAIPSRAPLHVPFKFATLMGGLAVPVLVTAGTFIRLPLLLVGSATRAGSVPGSTPEWQASVTLAIVVSVIVSLSLVYILSYVHLSDAKWVVSLATAVLFGLSIVLLVTGTVQPFTEDTARAVNVVHVVDSTGSHGKEKPVEYLSLFATTPGKLTKEAELLDEGFVCGTDKVVDFVTFQVEYGCWSYLHTDDYGRWNELDTPALRVNGDRVQHGTQERAHIISIDTGSSVRWALAINTEEVRDFQLRDVANSNNLIPLGKKNSVKGWHIIQFAGAKGAPTQFELALYGKREPRQYRLDDQSPLVKLRRDYEQKTPVIERVLTKFPAWCSFFGRSTNPRTLARLESIPVSSLATVNNSAIASS